MSVADERDLKIARREFTLEDEAWDRVNASRDAGRFNALLEGDWQGSYPSHSEADFALAVMLFRAFGEDPAKVRELFLGSGLAKPERQRAKAGTPEKYARHLDRQTLPKALKRARALGPYPRPSFQQLALWNEPPDDPAAPAERWPLYTGEQLAALPAPPWLVQDVLFASGLTLVYAEKGTYKSFVTLSLATAVATGKAWLGTRAVTQRTVVYVIAEGKGYFAKRIAALGQLDAPIRYVTVPVNLFQGQAQDFAAHVRAALGEVKPGLFVFDTLARSMVGGEENSNTDMGVVVDAARLLQQTFDAAVLLVHHTGKDGLTVRGGYALQAAADIVIRLTKTGPLAVTLTFENTKDVAEPDPVGLVLRPADQSLVVQLGPIAAGRAPDRSRPLTRDEMLEHIVNLCRPAPLNVQQIAAATGKSVRWITGEMIPVLLAAQPPRLTVEGTGVKGDAFRYLATVTPMDTT